MIEPQSHNLWLFLEVLARRKRLLITTILVVTLASVAVSLLLPKWYRATALLLPPKNLSTPIDAADSWSEVVSVTSNLNLPVRATPSDVYARMLRSSTVVSRVIEKFNLMEAYGEDNYEEVYEALMESSDFSVSAEGLLVVSVEDQNPQMAADLANAFVDELDRINAEIVLDRVSHTRQFLEDRLTQVKTEHDSARAALEEFQMINRAVDFDEQTRVALEQAAELKIQLAEVELKVQMSEMALGEDNAQMKGLLRKKSIIKRQLQQLENENVDSSFFSLPVASIPSLRGQYEVLYSRVRVSEALYQVLLEQSERAKIKEFEKMPTISVLDRAKPPTIKSRPQRTIIVATAFGLSIVLAIFLAALVDYLGRLRTVSPDDYGRLMLFSESFFGWLPGWKGRRRSAGGDTGTNN